MRIEGRAQHVLNIKYTDGSEESISFSDLDKAMTCQSRQKKLPQVVSAKIIGSEPK